MKKARRAPGTGAVYQTSSGRWIARLPDKRTLSVFDTEEEANKTLDAALVIAAEQGITLVGGVTLRAWFPTFLDDLERSKYPAMKNARSLWKVWISAAPFADLPVRAITKGRVEAWIEKLARKPLSEISTSYLDAMLGILRKGLDAAIKAGALEENPARGVVVPQREAPTSEAWDFLYPQEQTALITCKAIPEAYRLMITFALETGVRAGEQFCLHDRDVVDLDGERPHVVIRFGSAWRAPKGRKIRRPPLTPAAVAGLRRWFAIRDGWCAPHRNDRGRAEHGCKLVFPGSMGGLLHSDKLEDWKTWLVAAGINRRIRWHDLRHSAATSLVSGWRG